MLTVAYAHSASKEMTGTISKQTILARTVRGRMRHPPARVGASDGGPATVSSASARSSAGGPACARRPRAKGWGGGSAPAVGVLRGVRMASSLGKVRGVSSGPSWLRARD
ncbi:hypothetical protein GCM10011579_006330 [Streptomyces albiflavescens]|uniref:Uncharacterized protein n=1 Tax=Streptomyces albiflavescens TaxID=1623582 RepID=A0A918CYX6_9ACTN|nr:hypothetical protein GCM10011579_006330 [Streptomyces albiflavescens]